MGRQVCACFGAGEKIIIETLRTQKLATVADIDARLKADELRLLRAGARGAVPAA
jgi:hypothetical protein